MDNSEALETRIRSLEQDSERNQITHKEFFARFEAIKEQMARTDERYSNIIRDTTEIKSDLRQTKEAIQALKEKPGKKWEGLQDKVLGCVISIVLGGIIGAILVSIGLGG